MKTNINQLIAIVAASAALLVACACGGKAASQSAVSAVAPADTLLTAPVSADSLYAFVAAQTELGPRTPGSAGHAACVELITAYMQQCGIAHVDASPIEVVAPDGSRATAQNIFAQINSPANKRVLLLAHYDTRPWADQDPDPANHHTPIDGANDGASGVAVLMEMARVLPRMLPDSLGVDLLFTDFEDSGETAGAEDTWCIGTQHWVENMPYSRENRPAYGILLDMVGGTDALFHREYFSDRQAKPVLNRVWSIARRSGLGERFLNQSGGAVVDDHLPINRVGIPCIDIIESVNEHTGSFNPTWHTLDDNLQAIDRNTLRDVATVVANSILNP